MQRTDRGFDIGTGVLERTDRARGIPHPAIVVAQDRDARRGQVSRQQYELTMAADPILGSADDDHETHIDGLHRLGQDTDQAFTAAIEGQCALMKSG